jgi:predicted nucleotidyltransferase
MLQMSQPVVDARTEILLKLEQSMFTFYLTGSRAFGTNHSDSDYDFFVASDSQIGPYLQELDFFPIPCKYRDRLNTSTYHHDSGIDVQLCMNVNIKKAAQDILLENGILSIADKGFNKRVWNAIISAFQKGFDAGIVGGF